MGSGREYRGGYDDSAIEAMAVEDGRASVHDPSASGENTAPRVIELVNSTVAVLRHLVGHAVRQESLPLEVELERSIPEAKGAEQTALDDIELEEEARCAEALLARKTRRAGMLAPRGEDVRRYVVKLACLAGGDLVFIATTFQVFGLSDHLQLGVVPFSSDLYIAAFSSVLALLFLAHHAGEELKAISHLNRRRRERPETAEPRPGPEPLIYAAAWTLGAALVLFGVSVVRQTYLAEKGVPSYTLVFVAIQSGVFLAALALSISHAHPYAREWARVGHLVRRAARDSARSAKAHVELVGFVNGVIDRREALLAIAAQHARLGEVDAVRQVLLYVRRVQLSQPEPVGERLFPEELPTVVQPTDEELATILVGITAPPEFDRLDTDAVIRRRQGLRAALSEMREPDDPYRRREAGETGSAQLLLGADYEEHASHNGQARS